MGGFPPPSSSRGGGQALEPAEGEERLVVEDDFLPPQAPALVEFIEAGAHSLSSRGRGGAGSVYRRSGGSWSGDAQNAVETRRLRSSVAVGVPSSGIGSVTGITASNQELRIPSSAKCSAYPVCPEVSSPCADGLGELVLEDQGMFPNLQYSPHSPRPTLGGVGDVSAGVPVCNSYADAVSHGANKVFAEMPKWVDCDGSAANAIHSGSGLQGTDAILHSGRRGATAGFALDVDGAPCAGKRGVGTGPILPPFNSKLRYIAPTRIGSKLVAVCPVEEVEKNQKKWEMTLVGYVLGRRPFFQHLKELLLQRWKPKGSFEIFSREKGVFLFKFGIEEDYTKALEGGPWHIDGRPLVLKKWVKGENCDRDLLTRVPIWVRFPNLLVDLWSEELLSRMGSIIGVPLYMDQATSAQNRVNYARFCVEINVEDSLPEEVEARDCKDNFLSLQPVVYDWIPPRCRACKSFDHSEANCFKHPKIDGSWKKFSRGKVPGRSPNFNFSWRPVGFKEAQGTVPLSTSGPSEMVITEDWTQVGAIASKKGKEQAVVPTLGSRSGNRFNVLRNLPIFSGGSSGSIGTESLAGVADPAGVAANPVVVNVGVVGGSIGTKSVGARTADVGVLIADDAESAVPLVSAVISDGGSAEADLNCVEAGMERASGAADFIDDVAIAATASDGVVAAVAEVSATIPAIAVDEIAGGFGVAANVGVGADFNAVDVSAVNAAELKDVAAGFVEASRATSVVDEASEGEDDAVDEDSAAIDEIAVGAEDIARDVVQEVDAGFVEASRADSVVAVPSDGEDGADVENCSAVAGITVTVTPAAVESQVTDTVVENLETSKAEVPREDHAHQQVWNGIDCMAAMANGRFDVNQAPDLKIHVQAWQRQFGCFLGNFGIGPRYERAFMEKFFPLIKTRPINHLIVDQALINFLGISEESSVEVEGFKLVKDNLAPSADLVEEPLPIIVATDVPAVASCAEVGKVSNSAELVSLKLKTELLAKGHQETSTGAGRRSKENWPKGPCDRSTRSKR